MKRTGKLLVALIVLALLGSVPAAGEITIDASSNLGNIRPLYQGFGQGHITGQTGLGTTDTVATQLMEDVGIGLVRVLTHYNSMFPKSNDPYANPTDPKEYNFTRFDKDLAAIHNLGAIPIVNTAYTPIPLRRDTPPPGSVPGSSPPRDFDQYAEMVKRTVMHSTQGWNNGHYYNLPYWEIWNEPDLEHFWTGTRTEYFELYRKVALKIKEVDPDIKVGGPAEAYISDLWMDDFLDFCDSTDTPLDFISFHAYQSPDEIASLVTYVDERIAAHPDLGDVDTYISEWNLGADFGNEHHDDIVGATHNAATLIRLIESDCDLATRFRAIDSDKQEGDNFGVLFEDESLAERRKPAYFTIQAFHQMNETPIQLEWSDPEGTGLYLLAGKSEDGKGLTVLIVNYGEVDDAYSLVIDNLSWGNVSGVLYERFLLDAGHSLELVETMNIAGGMDSFAISESLGAYSLQLIQVSAIPEPSTLLLLISGSVLGLGYGLKRKSIKLTADSDGSFLSS